MADPASTGEGDGELASDQVSHNDLHMRQRPLLQDPDICNILGFPSILVYVAAAEIGELVHILDCPQQVIMVVDHIATATRLDHFTYQYCRDPVPWPMESIPIITSLCIGVEFEAWRWRVAAALIPGDNKEAVMVFRPINVLIEGFLLIRQPVIAILHQGRN